MRQLAVAPAMKPRRVSLLVSEATGTEGFWVWAKQFKTPGGARSELANELKVLKATVPGYEPFAVPGIPGAFGYAAEGPGLNVAFASGHYYYLVGEFVSAVSASSEATITAAAKRLYRGVHG